MRIGLMATPIDAPDFSSRGAEYLFKESGGNTGNFAFVHALNKQLGLNTTHIPWWYSAEKLRDSCDIVVIACANQLGKHTDLMNIALNLEGANLPIIAVGLGAQSNPNLTDVELTQGTRRWLDVIAAHPPSKAPNIGVRGDFTGQQIAKLGHVDRVNTIGCPSNFINTSPGLGKTIEQAVGSGKLRVAVPAGHHLWSNLTAIERALATIVETTDGIYVAQSEIDMLRLAAEEFDNIEPATLEAIREYVRPELDLPKFKEWISRYMVAFSSASSWMDRMADFNFVVGARFHGVMLAMQAGTRGGVIAHDSRTIELCTTTGIPFVRYDEIDLLKISECPVECFPFDGDSYDARRRVLAERYSSLLQGGGIDPIYLEPIFAAHGVQQ